MTIKIGILSFAHMHAFSYASCLKQLATVELVGIADDDAARGAEMARHFETAYFGHAEALLDKRLDGVLICAENAAHHPLTELAAPRTPYILCEKPISTTLIDAQAMIDICAAHGTQLQIAFPVRFAPAVQQLRTLLASGQFGRIYSIQATNRGQMPDGWFLDQKLAGGGAVMDHTVHVIDLLRWFWNTEVTRVYAEVGRGQLHPGLAIDDVGLLSFQLANGAYGTLDTSWSRPQSYPTWGDVELELVGELGTARLDSFSQNLTLYDDRAVKAQWPHWGSDMDMGLISDFVETIAQGRAPSISGQDGLKALEVALAAYLSAQRGEPVALPLSGEG
jgi:predicted dehydrogenase